MRVIKASARTSFKVPGTPMGDIFYTFEYGEERSTTDETYEQDKSKLWDDVNTEVAKQITDTLNQYKNN